MRFRARNTGWLAVIGAMVGLAVLPGGDPLGAALLVSLFGAAAAATLLEFQPARLVERSRSSLTALRMSAEARESVERARRRGGSLHQSVMLLDIGLISAQSSDEGLVMRRSRNLSKEDDGVRPFAVLHVQPEDADRNALIRFEFIDRHGQQQYVHEMNAYLRDGEMNVLTDRQMPLYMNDDIDPGEWDLRVYVDNRLIGTYAFTIAPSLEDRFPRAARRLRDDSAVDEQPLRLEELLREQSQSRSQRGR
jgi:hypothetical protein